jgi:hypothetical protein|tara:strand:- start:1079 stop:1264 length:186 start_codon:yes stop_codon:yes gene_type:complete
MTAIIYNFAEEIHKHHTQGKVSLEYLVRVEMVDLGYDPNNKNDVIEYWEERYGNDIYTDEE